MKKCILTGMLMLMAISVKSQSYIGFLTDNYSGVHSVINNPANIVDSRFKIDINLAGVSAFAGNDYYGLGFSDLLDDNFAIEEDGITFPKDKNNIRGNVDVLGPSFMFNIDEKNSIALFSRGRFFFGLNEVNGTAFGNIADGFDANEDFSVNQGDLFYAANAWAEIGLTYARVLMNKDQHFLKGGISVKYLQGLGSSYAKAENLTINYDADGAGTEGNVTTTGGLSYGYSENLRGGVEDFEVVDGAIGIGGDIGFTYEWRPDYKKYTSKDSNGKSYMPRDINTYKLKIGVSLTDFGTINYDEGLEEQYDVNATVTETDFEDVELDQLGTLYTLLSSGESSKTTLPTAVHLNVDWNINQKFYLNLNGDLSISSKNKINSNSITNLVSLTPRFESKWFSFYLPVSLAEYSGIQAGAGFRAGPLYVGSGSIISLLINDESKAADVYAGLKIPIYQSSPKDADGDGVLDKVDECPKTKGPKANFGCPWPDTDGDTVLDKDDNCVDVPGEVENAGCPWLDTDGDTVLDKDDSCPDEPGAVDNYGCPWTDKDGDSVLDKDDNCPDVAGTVANNGCPEITEEIQKTLNAYAAQVLFDSGKSSIKDQSFSKLTEIKNILREYPNAKFTVEGHTDSVGSSKLNQRLSDSRANAVKKYLVDQGIDQFRLAAVGYGESKPIASNKSKKGRAQNRRVEINLVPEN